MIAVEKKEQNMREAFFSDDAMINIFYMIEAQSLWEGLLSLNLPIIKNFLCFVIIINWEIINNRQKKITVDSMNTFAEWFFAEFAWVTDNCINEKNRCAVYNVSACWSEI